MSENRAAAEPASRWRVRAEEAGDEDAICAVNDSAFGNKDKEGRLVGLLREQGLVRVSVVAIEEGEVIGHALFSAIQVVHDGEAVEALALAPVAVAPAHQRRGIGSALIREGLERCREAGHTACFVLGHKEYYPRFGFSNELAEPFECVYAGEHFMALELVPGALEHLRGEVRYSSPFSEL